MLFKSTLIRSVYDLKYIFFIVLFAVLNTNAFGQTTNTWSPKGSWEAIPGDTNWNNSANWSLGRVPITTDKVVITYAHGDLYPVIDGNTANAYSINIESPRQLTIQNNAQLTVTEKITTNGKIIIDNNSIVNAKNFEITSGGGSALDMDASVLNIEEDIAINGPIDTGTKSTIYAENLTQSNSDLSQWIIDDSEVYVYNKLYTQKLIELVNGSIVQTKDLEMTNSGGSEWKLYDTSVLTVEEDLTLTSKMTLYNNASLIQTSTTDENTYGAFYQGELNIYRTVESVRNTDYVYWSSPIDNYDISNIGNTSHRYIWSPTVDHTGVYASNFGNWESASGSMIKGKGYIVRGGPSGHIDGGEYTQLFSLNLAKNGINYKFNNGPIEIPVFHGGYNGGTYNEDGSGDNGPSITKISNEDDNWNLIGNPYPSAISIEAFLTENVNIIEGGVRIWTHGTEIGDYDDPFYQDFVKNYTAADYITYTNLGSSTPPPGDSSDYIASCQGFFVSMRHDAASGSNVIFNNSMREYRFTYTNSNFYKTVETTQKSRIWLNLIAEETKSINTMLLGYTNGATKSKDPLYDSVIMDHNTMNIYSLIEEEPMIIQGRPLPFEITDKIPLGITLTTKDFFSIGISKVDGLFENNQDIYLEDTYTNVVHNLRNSPYQFTSEAGTFNDRFILGYQDKSLNIDDIIGDSEFKIIATKNFIKVSTSTNTINNIIVYDVLGRVIYQVNKLNASDVKLNQLKPTNSPLIVKAVLTNGTTKTQKVMY
ncbi:T9SS sorting signal type C domain-containing protein [Formosa sediminum]|uniref:T9SS sorting signal type C domain-containing protein n=1 Tax=Formosa sediminum TaxID=2594004 RepID=A0A516GMK3_9FLAO|nr:T9SS sorting signal type C domain-containing protein [Formosa sediminum]QDO92729.1 T9SS sorting signal type C domain-containing protein [Formosa sediminum]